MTRTLQSTLVIAALCLPVHALAAPIFFDFGDGARQTAGNYNNISVSTPISLSVADAVDAAGASTGIGLTASGFYNGSNQSGPTVPTGDAAIFDGEATRDNAFGHAGAFGTNPLTPLALLDITGLDPAKQYSFVFFGSRIPASNNRETQFEVVGANSALAALNPSNNSSDVANVLGISPTAAGTLQVKVSPGPNNNSAEQFYYLGAMRLSVVPEPATFVLLAAGLAGLVTHRRRSGR